MTSGFDLSFNYYYLHFSLTTDPIMNSLFGGVIGGAGIGFGIEVWFPLLLGDLDIISNGFI